MEPELTDEQIGFLKRLRYGVEVHARQTIYDKIMTAWFERIGDHGFICTELGRVDVIADPKTGTVLNFCNVRFHLTSDTPQVMLSEVELPAGDYYEGLNEGWNAAKQEDSDEVR